MLLCRNNFRRTGRNAPSNRDIDIVTRFDVVTFFWYVSREFGIRMEYEILRNFNGEHILK